MRWLRSNAMIFRTSPLWSVLLLAGCAGFQPQPVEQPLTPPAQWHQETNAGETVNADWWQAFGDEQLNRLVNRAYANNPGDRKSTRLNSSHVRISYAVFCLKK